VSPRYVGLEIRIECEQCWQSLPINGPVRGSIRCAFCGETVALADHVVGPMKHALKWYDEVRRDVEERSVSLKQDAYYRFMYVKQEPRCVDCAQPLPVSDVEPGTDGEILCSCGAACRTAPPPDWVTAEVPSASQLFCCEPEAVASTPPPACSCPKCGGPLALDTEIRRIHRCSYCQTRIFIPEDVWTKLHPTPKLRRWFVRFD